MINSVVLMGRLVRDPELRTTTTGIDVCSFTIAVDRNYASQGQERQADFINCVAWRATASFISKYFQKGSMIAVTGSLQSRSYDDRDGKRRTAYEVVIDQASFTGSKGETGGARSASPAPQAEQPAYSTAQSSDFEMIADDDDLPF